ncbi:hypothetical protein T459_02920 [Capsicum annuum]|uniref:Ubiquitin-like protease family profile domain-containing protein n=1 Tax=Capsicum annuum TaxID=4072 RepID=A0A2G3ALF9_CAPAN|nr:hypothetical protein T459_02920 [Capsicum annuum]
MRTLLPRAAKAAGMKTPVQSKADSHVEEVAVLKLESHVEKEAFIFKKVFDAFREEVCQDFKGVREEFTRIHQLVKKKFKKMVKAIQQSKQQHEDTDVEAQQMNYVGVETSPQQFSPTVDQNLDENQDGTKGCTDLHPDKTNIEIDSQHLIPDELLQSINLDYNLSENIVHHDVRITDEKLDDTNLSNSQLTILDELLPSLNAYQRESITRHSLTTCEEEQGDEHFNDKKFESVVQDHCQKNKENVGSSSKPDMHGEVDLGMEEQIMTTPKIQELTTDEQRDETVWLDSQDTIPDDLLLSLNVYNSKSIIVHPSANRKLQTLIPKLRIRRSFKFNESPYTMKFGSAVAQHIDVCFYYLRKKSKYDPNGSYKFSTIDCNFMNIIRDCGVYMAIYAECLSYGHKVLANEFDPNALRTRSVALLWDYGTKKQDANAQSDVEAPLSLLGGLLNFGGSTILPSTLSGIRQSSLCGNG